MKAGSGEGGMGVWGGGKLQKQRGERPRERRREVEKTD